MNEEVFVFLEDLKKNNNREWFSEEKDRFEKLKQQITEFFESIHQEMRVVDEIDQFKIYRMYRDVRFSKDKTPYKSHFSMYLRREQPTNRGGFYLHIEPGNSFAGGGFWNPEKDDLFRIRKEIEIYGEEFEQIITSVESTKYFEGKLLGDHLKTAPKDFDKTHPQIAYIRQKQFLLQRKFTDQEVLDPSFSAEVIKTFLAMHPFLKFMTEALTTNLNGEYISDK